MSAEDVAEYRCLTELFDNMQAILKDHFNQNEIISSRALIQNVIYKLRDSHVALEKVELSDPSVSTWLVNALLIRDKFKEETDFRNIYESVCDKFLVRYKQFAQEVRTILDEDDESKETINIKGLAENLKAMRMSLPILRCHLSEKIVLELYNDTLKKLFEHFEKISQTCELMMNDRQQLSPKEYKQIELVLKRLNSASDNLILQDLCETKLNEYYSKFLNSITTRFNDIYEKVSAMFKSNNNDLVIENVERLLREMESIHKLEETTGFIAQRTSENYFRMTEKLQTFMQQLTVELEKLLEFDLTNEGKNVQNYSPIGNKLSRLNKNAEWIENINPGAYKELILKIECLLSERYEKIGFSLQRDSIYDIGDPKNILEVKPILTEMRAMYTLEKCLPSLKEQRERAEELFNERISKISTKIENDVNNKNMNGSDNILTFDAEQYEKALLFLTNLKDIGLSNIESSITEILNKLNNLIIDYGSRLQQEITQKFENITKHMDEKTIFDNAHVLASCLNQLTFLSENVPSIYNCINGAQKIRNNRQVFANYLNNSRRTLEESSKTDSTIHCRQLNIVDALSPIDQFCQWKEDAGFSKLNEKYKSTLSELEKTAFIVISESLKTGDYAKISSEISDFSFTNKENEFINSELNKSLKKIPIELKMSLKVIFKKVDTDDKLQEFTDFREKVDKIMTILDKPNLKNRIEKKLLQDLEQLEKDLNEIYLNFVQDSLNTVDQYVDSDNLVQVSVYLVVYMCYNLANQYTI